MPLYNVFVAFVGLNNNTILAKQNIEFGSFTSNCCSFADVPGIIVLLHGQIMAKL